MDLFQIASVRYNGHLSRSKARGHVPPVYDRDTLYSWMLKQDGILEMHKNWIDSGKDRNLAVSIDRILDSRPYTLSNIQIMTWQEHMKKTAETAHLRIRNKKVPRARAEERKKIIPDEPFYYKGRLVEYMMCIQSEQDKEEKRNNFLSVMVDNRRKVECSNGKTYNSVQEAADDLGVGKSAVSKCCNKKQHTAGGYTMKFT